jgi:hypothetical protein
LEIGASCANLRGPKKIKGLRENDFIMASKIDRTLDRSGLSLDRQQRHGKYFAIQVRPCLPHIRTDNQPVTQITVIEPEPGEAGRGAVIDD